MAKKQRNDSSYQKRVDAEIQLLDQDSLDLFIPFAELIKKEFTDFQKKGWIGADATVEDFDNFINYTLEKSNVTAAMLEKVNTRMKNIDFIMEEDRVEFEKQERIERDKLLKEKYKRYSVDEKEEREKLIKTYEEIKDSELEKTAREKYKEYQKYHEIYKKKKAEYIRDLNELGSMERLYRNTKSPELKKRIDEFREEIQKGSLKRYLDASSDNDLALANANGAYWAARKQAQKLGVATHAWDPMLMDYVKKNYTESFEGLMKEKILPYHFRTVMRDKLAYLVNTGADPEAIKTMIEDLVVGKKGDKKSVMGLLKENAKDILYQYQGALQMVAVGNKKILGFLYEGPVDKKTRIHCSRWVGMRIIEYDQVQVEIDRAKRNSYGLHRWTKPISFAIERGGYHCRHTARPITDVVEWEKEKDIKAKEDNVFEAVTEAIDDVRVKYGGLLPQQPKRVLPASQKEAMQYLQNLREKLAAMPEGEELLAAEGYVRNLERMHKIEVGLESVLQDYNQLSDSIVDATLEFVEKYDLDKNDSVQKEFYSIKLLKGLKPKLERHKKVLLRLVDEMLLDAKEHHRLLNNVELRPYYTNFVEPIKKEVIRSFGHERFLNSFLRDAIVEDVKRAIKLYPEDIEGRREYLRSLGYRKDEFGKFHSFLERRLRNFFYRLNGLLEKQAFDEIVAKLNKDIDKKLKEEYKDMGVFYMKNFIDFVGVPTNEIEAKLVNKKFIPWDKVKEVKEEIYGENAETANIFTDRNDERSYGMLAVMQKKHYQLLFESGKNIVPTYRKRNPAL